MPLSYAIKKKTGASEQNNPNKTKVVKPSASTTTAAPKKTAYQMNMSVNSGDNKWYSGSKPTYRETLGQIGKVMKEDREAGNKILNNFMLERENSTSDFYTPYAKPTNSAVDYLTQRGFDVNGINNDTYKAYSGYLIYNGTTNSPSKPNAKKGTQEQWDAYNLHQYGKAVETTNSVNTEWAAMQDELAYWANRTDLNLSDDEIIDRVFSDENMSKKYKTLKALDDSLLPGGTLLELNNGTDYSKDNAYGVIWAARNNGGTGDSTANTMLSAMGEGNQWEENKALRDKRNKNPYSTGSTMDEEGLYFNRASFDWNWVNQNADMITASGDKTAIKYLQNVVNGLDTLDELKKEKQQMLDDIDLWAQDYTPEQIISWLEEDEDNAYKGLKKLDKSLERPYMGLEQLPSEFDYSFDEIKQLVYDKCNKYKKEDAVDFTDSTVESMNTTTEDKPVEEPKADGKPVELNGGAEAPTDLAPAATPEQTPEAAQSPTPTQKPAETPTPTTAAKATELASQENLTTATEAVSAQGTDEEKTVFNSGKTTSFNEASNAIAFTVNTIENDSKVISKLLDKNTVTKVIPIYNKIDSYDDEKEKYAGYLSALNATNQRIQELQIRASLNAEPYTGQTTLFDSMKNYQPEEWEEIKKGLTSQDPEEKAGAYSALAFWADMNGVLNTGIIEPEVVDGKIEGVPEDLVKLANMALQEGGNGGNFGYEPLSEKESEELVGLIEDRDNLTKAIENSKAYLDSHKEEYDNAVKQADIIENNYANSNRFLSMNGQKVNSNLLQDIKTGREAVKTWTPTNFDGNQFDNLVRSGKATREELAPYASYTVSTDIEKKQAIQNYVKACDEFGIPLSDQERANADQVLKELDREIYATSAYMLDDDPEFEKIAKESIERGATEEMSDLTKANIAFLKNDSFAEYFGQNSPFKQQFFENTTQQLSLVGGGPLNLISSLANLGDKSGQLNRLLDIRDSIDEQEVKRYFYLLREEGEDAANKYFSSLSNPENGAWHTRAGNAESEKVQKSASGSFGEAASAYGLSFLTKVAGNIQGWISSTKNALYGKEDNPYGLGNMGNQHTQDLRAGALDYTKAKVNEYFGDGYDGFVDFMFNATTSAGDSMINSLLTQMSLTELAEAVPFLSKVSGWLEASEGSNALTKFGKSAVKDWVSALPMAAGAAVEAKRQAIADGFSTTQVDKIFWATLFAESVTEAVTVGNIKGMFEKGGEEALGSLIKDLVSNGMEEAVGEGFNEWIEMKFDDLIKGSDSEYNQMVKYYHETEGMPLSVAERYAGKKMISRILESAASGFVSANVSGPISYYSGSRKNGNFNKAVTEMLSRDSKTLANMTQTGNRTNAAIGISSIFKSGGFADNYSNAAAQHFVSDISKGSAVTATSTMSGLLSASGNDAVNVKNAIAYGSMTSGVANRTLQDITQKAENGEQITFQDVDNLMDALDEDLNGSNAETFKKQIDQTVTENRIANKTRDKMASPETANAIRTEEKKVTQAKENKKQADNNLEDAQEKVKSVSESMGEAVDSYLGTEGEEEPTNGSIDKEMGGEAEQTVNELAGADALAQQREDEQKKAEQKVNEAKAEKERVESEKLNQARQEAQAEVAQEDQQAAEEQAVNEQNSYEESVKSNQPTVGFGKTIEVTDNNGQKVKVTGIYDIYQSEDGFEGTYYLTTEDGRIIAVDSENIDDVDDAFWDAENEFEGEGGASARNNKFSAKVKPAAYFDQSFTAQNKGKDVHIIGLAGYEQNQSGFKDPIYMGSDGKTYRYYQLEMDNANEEKAYQMLNNKGLQRITFDNENQQGLRKGEGSEEDFDIDRYDRRQKYQQDAKYQELLQYYKDKGVADPERMARGALRQNIKIAKKVDLSQRVTEGEGKRLVNRAAKRLGLQVQYADMADGVKGSYANGVVTLSNKLSTGDALLEIAMHEITHSLESTTSYQQYRQLVLDTLFGGDEEARQTAISDMIKNRADRGITLETEEDAIKEIVAEFTQDNLADINTINRMIDSGLGAKIRNILQKINQLFKGQTLTPEQQAQANKYQEAERLLKQAMKERRDNELNKYTPEQTAEAGQAIQYATDNPVRNFQGNSAVEMRRDGLIAVHNLFPSALEKVLDLAGFPMPSIAIVRADRVWRDKSYGPISIFFGREAVDPDLGKVVYNGDANTPTLKKDAIYKDIGKALKELEGRQPRGYDSWDPVFGSLETTSLAGHFKGYMQVRSMDEMRDIAYRTAGNFDQQERDALYKNYLDKVKGVLLASGLSDSDIKARKYMKYVNRGVFEAFDKNRAAASQEMSDQELAKFFEDSINEQLHIAGLKDNFDFSSNPEILKAITDFSDFLCATAVFDIRGDGQSQYNKEQYFQEGKTPEILGFDKVKALLLPDNIPANTVQRLLEAGIPEESIFYYQSDNEDDRINVARNIPNTTAGVQFSAEDDYSDALSATGLNDDYMEAIETGAIERAEQDVEEYARDKGYTDEAYHGTDDFGFTEFDMEESQDAIFVSYDEDLASTYSESNTVRHLSEGQLEKISNEEIASILNRQFQQGYIKGFADQDSGLFKTVYNEQTGMFDVMSTAGADDFEFGNYKTVDSISREEAISYIKEQHDALKEEHVMSAVSGIYKFFTRPGNQLVVDADGNYWDSIPFDLYGTKVTGDIDNEDYEYTDTDWDEEFDPEFNDFTATTRQIAKWAKAHGYTSVRINNVVDHGPNQSEVKENTYKPRDIGIFFNKEDVKSADTLTYDNNGNIIPLTERFSQNPDFRYSSEEDYSDALKATGLQQQGLKTQPVTPTQKHGNETKAKYSPAKIASNLADALGVGNYLGTRKYVGRGREAFYDRHSDSVVAKSKDAGNYLYTVHELGHAIANRFGLTPTTEMMANFKTMAPQFFAGQYKSNELPGEALAEFMWRYLKDETEARAFAGNAFYDDFENTIRGTEEGKAIAEAREQLQMYLNADANTKIGAHIVNQSDKTQRTFKELVRHVIDSTIDSTSAAEDFDLAVQDVSGKKGVLNKVRAMALWANTAGKQATSILSGAGLTDAYGNIIGESLADRFESAGFKGTKENLDLLNRYMLALHSLARDAQGKAVFDDTVTTQERLDFIADIQKNHPEVAAAEQQFQKFRKEFLQEFLVNTGLLSQEAFDAMNKMYPHYVPTYRVKQTKGVYNNAGKGRTYQIKEAKGSTEDIYNPMDSFFSMVNTIVSQNARNRAAKAFDRMYQQNEGLGLFAQQMPKNPNSRAITESQIQKLLEGKISDTDMDALLTLVGDNLRGSVEVEPGNTLTVTRDDGSTVQYQFNNMELFNLLSGVNQKQSDALLNAVGFVTRGMSALTTGSNPIFAARNFMRDFQNSVNYGSWASNYGSGIMKWLASAYEVWKGSDDYNDYQALGGGGWTRVDPSRTASRNELYSDIFKGYNTSNVGQTAKWAGKKVWNAITLARLNEVVEQASRFAEYKYGKHDLKSMEGRIEGYLAAQEATVDFNRSGGDRLAVTLKKLIPFFNASVQGVYRTARMLTESERERAPQRFAKTVINTALTSAICTALLKANMDDDDKKEFEMLSDDLKSKHFYLPNFAPSILGEAPLIRIPLAQDPLTYAVHNAVTNALWSGDTEDGMMIDLAATADTILDNLNPIGSGTVFEPILGVAANKSWFGNKIVPAYLERNKYAPDQYTEDTPRLFIEASRFLHELTNGDFSMSPMKLQYLAEQYSGFLGQLAIPAISPNSNGELGGIKEAINSARKKFTSDPLTSNSIMSDFYDGADIISNVIEEANQGKPLNILRRGLTQEEAGQAYEEAKTLNGIITDIKSDFNKLYSEINTINDNKTLTDHDKYELTSKKRRQMVEIALDASEKISEYKDKYITGSSLVERMFKEGSPSYKPTPEDKMPETFKDDSDEDYMKKAQEVYKATNSSAALPHPDKKVSVTNKAKVKDEYTISDEEWPKYEAEYKRAYEKTVTNKGKRWKTMSTDQKKQVMTSAHAAGNEAMRKLYEKEHPDINKNTTGQYGLGNIDLNNRKVVENDDGSISTERSMSFYDEDSGKEVLIPTVVNGRIVSDEEAIDHYYETGEYLGMFDTPEEADRYAERLHNRQDWYYNR